MPAFGKKPSKGAVYVCHTYYHVYVSMLKELNKPEAEQHNATIVLSTMSTDFESLRDRLLALNYFKDVVMYEEKDFTAFPEVEKYHHPSGNFIASIWNRFLFTKKYGRAQETLVPVDFREYSDVYVFCDSDPIGYYLNWKHIYYHALEDGLDTLKYRDAARADNEPNFDIKAMLSKKFNILFIQNGYGKYCLDMEVNNNSILKYPCPYRIEESRLVLADKLTQEDKNLILKAFVKDSEKIKSLISEGNKKTVLILTEPLCDLDTRKRIFEDIIASYKDEYTPILKQHPRDELDYTVNFPDTMLIDRTVPMEMLNFFEGFHVSIVVGVFTNTESISFADEKVRLGCDFMDNYEPEDKHRISFESVKP